MRLPLSVTLFTKIPTLPPSSSLNYPTMAPSFSFTTNNATTLATGNRRFYREKEKVVVIMGPTGSGKSRLSVDLATRFPGEVINSDKIQVYKGLDITTNKMSVEETRGVKHHLLGVVDSVSDGELTPSEFRSRGGELVNEIVNRDKVPYIAGGSNSFIYALLVEKYNPDSDVFAGLESVCNELRYKCCFLWVDVCLPVLNEYLKERVDEMIDSGMVDELAEYYLLHDSLRNNTGGLSKAIGVPEFEKYFKYTCQNRGNDSVREGLYNEAVSAIKENTCQLAKRQKEKIQRLKEGGWKIERLDGTDSFKAVLEGTKSWSDIWEKQVVEPSVKIVKRFLEEE